MNTIRGSCLCGAIRYEMTGPPLVVNHCHCKRCRKARGVAHATNLLVDLDGIRFTQGESLLTSFKLPEAKTFTHVFCRVCGASMPRLDQTRGIGIIPLGSFDDDPGIRPTRHIHVASKAIWDDIYDDLPRFEEGPPSLR